MDAPLVATASRGVTPALPDGAIVIARIVGAHGVAGAIKLKPISGSAETLLSLSEIGVRIAGSSAPPRVFEARLLKARVVGDLVSGFLDGVSNREAAALLAGAEIFTFRNKFARPAEGSFYWVDLIGCQVVTDGDEALGKVSSLVSTGVHDVLVIGSDASDGATKERLIPFVNQYVTSVDLVSKRIVVDWDPAWD